jgi:hypothetical protein
LKANQLKIKGIGAEIDKLFFQIFGSFKIFFSVYMSYQKSKMGILGISDQNNFSSGIGLPCLPQADGQIIIVSIMYENDGEQKSIF